LAFFKAGIASRNFPTSRSILPSTITAAKSVGSSSVAFRASSFAGYGVALEDERDRSVEQDLRRLRIPFDRAPASAIASSNRPWKDSAMPN
jgi:hypothetical protein